MRVGFEHFEHAADVGVRGRGGSPAEAFGQTARALFALVAESPETVREETDVPVFCEADDLVALLVAYLNELISLSDGHRLVFATFVNRIEEVSPGRWRLTGVARGEKLDRERHRPTVEPKGATYTGALVAREDDGWVAQCVVDV